MTDSQLPDSESSTDVQPRRWTELWPMLIPLILVGGLLWTALRFKQRARLMESGGYVQFEAPTWSVLEALAGPEVRSLIASPTHLRVGGERPSRSDLRMIAGFDELVDFSGSGMTDSDMAYLKRCSKLEMLSLQPSSLTADGIRSLSRFPKLKHIWITTDQTISGDVFGAFAAMPQLEVISIEPKGFTELQLEPLSKVSTLNQLWLGRATIRDGDLTPLSTLPNFQWLTLSECDISPNGLKGLPSTLVSLQLNNSSITDDHIPSLEYLTWLMGISLFGTQVTDEGARRLQMALPRTRVANSRGENVPLPQATPAPSESRADPPDEESRP